MKRELCRRSTTVATGFYRQLKEISCVTQYWEKHFVSYFSFLSFKQYWKNMSENKSTAELDEEMIIQLEIKNKKYKR